MRLVHIFWPLITYSSPSRTARVVSDASSARSSSCSFVYAICMRALPRVTASLSGRNLSWRQVSAHKRREWNRFSFLADGSGLLQGRDLVGGETPVGQGLGAVLAGCGWG